ncbi:MAG TPA: CPXCG motif-containing cysteine-rich protein [Steroidobacteraceae bacterium]|nr:CPXCG motif-containing cysteine-rich protein [Steroidobacteraceae bacterium]
MAARKEIPPGVDELYGLEPVIEPGAGEEARDDPEGLRWRSVQCPYCGEAFETVVDLSCGSMSYIEDCQVCCQPIEFSLEVAHDGTLARLRTARSD